MAIVIDKSYKINSASDYYINVTKMTDRDGTELDLSEAHFRLEFFGYDVYGDLANGKAISDERKYTASYDGTTRVNNSVVDGVLRIRLESNSVKRGRLYYRQVERYANAEFSDGYEDVVSVGYLDIILSPVSDNTLPTGEIEATVSVGGVVSGSGSIVIDPVPTQNSTNAVSSGGVYDAIDQSVGNIGAYLSTI